MKKHILNIILSGLLLLSTSTAIAQKRDSLRKIDTLRIIKLEEVMVTAAESKGITSSSKIGKKAMEHLQPSSFADLLELLPGGLSSDPYLTSPNIIRLREVPVSSSNYSTTSLGTAFFIDGIPLSTNANMQYTSGAWETSATSRDYTNQGVDMRTISTDEINSVEIVRGIPSVEYGDLTSGLIKIERKFGGSDIEARFKADMKSKLFYVGKGFELPNRKLSLNAGIDYLDAKADPRNNLENYKRISTSLRLRKTLETDKIRYIIDGSFDYGGSFDNEKVDPDLNKGKEDSYKSKYNRYAISGKIKLFPNQRTHLASVEINGATSYQHDLIKRVKFMQLQRDTPISDSKEEGEHDAKFLPYSYMSDQKVDGKPFNAFVKAVVNMNFDTKSSTNILKIGSDWNMDKNYGRGQVYDVTRPPSTGMSTRPRSYNAIRANHLLSFFAEVTSNIEIGGSMLSVMTGVRTGSMLNLPENYKMRGKFFTDPRLNLQWKFPEIQIGKKSLIIDIAGGVGKHSKTPTLDQLYPELLYKDILQLNYYHTNAEYRKINMRTYIVDPTNPDLEPAKNIKWEVRSDFQLGGNNLSVTYFEENMTSGFRYSSRYRSYQYKSYDASGLNHSTITSAPDVSTLPYTLDTALYTHTVVTNGSRTFKKGVEFTFSSKRIESIKTRITMNGAWFYSRYENSEPIYERPSTIINGKQIQYIGIYKDGDAYIREALTSNLMFDTDLPSIGLGLSLSMQCTWFTAAKNDRKSGIPSKYIDPSGNIHDFTEADQTDMYLQWLVKTYSDALFNRTVVPFEMNVNLKATKKFLNNKIMAALFVNKIVDSHPSYKQNGITVRRSVTPYFGMELNFKI